MTDDHTDALTDLATSLQRAMSDHDLEAFSRCLPWTTTARLRRTRIGRFVGEQVQTNWTAIFSGIPDFRADLIATAASGHSLWTEWRWHGTHADASQLQMAGVIVMGFRDASIAWGRLYVEPIEESGAGIDAAVSKMSGNT